MNNFGRTPRRPTDLNRAARLPEISAVRLNPQTGEETGRVANAAPKVLLKWLIVCGAASLVSLRPLPCWATTGGLPWDQTLTALQDMLAGPVAHTAITIAFIGAGFLYAVGGYDKQAGRLAASGIGGCLALSAIRLLNFVFP